jgi:hypothetical protein
VVRKVAERMKDVSVQVPDLTNGLIATGLRSKGESLNLHGGFHQAVSDWSPGALPGNDAFKATLIESTGEAFDALFGASGFQSGNV